MRFPAIAAAVLGFVASTLAQDPTAGFDPITAPKTGSKVTAGESFTIKWEPGTYTTGTSSIILVGGADPSSLVVLSTLTASIANSAGQYNWAVDSKLGTHATYGIKIVYQDGTTFQWSEPFTITKSGGGGGSASASSSGSSSAVSSSSYATVSSSGSVTKSSSIASSTTSAISYSTSVYSTTSASNLSTTATGVTKTTTSTLLTSTSTTRAPSSTSSVPNGSAKRAAAGSIALLGGLAAAVFAL